MRKLFVLLMIFVDVLLLSMLDGCCFLPYEEVVFTVPESLSADGKPVTVLVTGRGEAEERYSVAAGGTLCLSMEKNVIAAITVELPVSGGQEDCTAAECAACLYPFSKEIVTGSQGYEGALSFTASVVRCLYNGASGYQEFSLVQKFVGRFNWQKFLSLVQTYENPWTLDRTLAVTSIAKGVFTASSLKVR